MIRAIIFDFDGIIVDSEPVHYEAFLRIAQREFDITFTYDDYLRDYVGFDDRDGFRAMAQLAEKRLSLDDPTLKKLIRDKAKTFDAIVEEGVTPIPGVLDFIEKVYATIPIAIASGAGRADIDLMLGKLGIAHRFPIIVSADDVARSKPDPQTFRQAFEQIAAGLPDLKPAECLAIEDTAGGIESARGAGLHVLGMTTTTTSAALHRAHRVTQNFEGLTLEQLQAWFG